MEGKVIILEFRINPLLTEECGRTCRLRVRGGLWRWSIEETVVVVQGRDEGGLE